MPDAKKKTSKLSVLPRDKEEEKRDKKIEALKESQGLFVATPVHSEVTLHYMKSCLDLQKECLLNSTSITFQLMKSSLVTQGRNLCVAAFLSSKADQMCFIDADISFSVRSIYRMYECPYEVSLVPYPMKTVDANKFRQDDIKRPSDHPDTKGYIFPVELTNMDAINMHNGFVEIKKGPAGCMMIKRSAFDKLIKAYPDLTVKQTTMINGKMVERPNYYNFFDTYYSKKTKLYLGEDFNFCKLWTDIGGKIYALADEEISHVGEKMYSGKLLQELTKTGGKSIPLGANVNLKK